MSSESNDIASSALKRRDAAAAAFKQATGAQKKKQKDNSFYRVSLNMFRDVSLAFGIQPSTVARAWRDNFGPKAPLLFTASQDGSPMAQVYAYSQTYTKQGFMDLIRKGTLKDSGLWDFLVKCHRLCPDPIVLVRVGKTTWVLHPMSNMGVVQFAMPRIWIPIDNLEDRLLTPAALYVKEHVHVE